MISQVPGVSRRSISRSARSTQAAPSARSRPFLQAFRQGADEFNTHFIFQQVRAARRGRADGFLFWHPGHTYGVVRRAMRREVRYLLPFPIPQPVIRARARSAPSDPSGP